MFAACTCAITSLLLPYRAGRRVTMAGLVDGAGLAAALDGPNPPLVFDCTLFFGHDGLAQAKVAYSAAHLPAAAYMEVHTPRRCICNHVCANVTRPLSAAVHWPHQCGTLFFLGARLVSIYTVPERVPRTH